MEVAFPETEEAPETVEDRREEVAPEAADDVVDATEEEDET